MLLFAEKAVLWRFSLQLTSEDRRDLCVWRPRGQVHAGYLKSISRLQLSTFRICPGIFFAERLNKSEKSCGLRVILVAKNQACWKGYTLPSRLPSSHQAESVLMQPHLEHTSLVLQQAVYRRRALSPLRSRVMYEAIEWSRCTSSNDATNTHKHHTGASASQCKGIAYSWCVPFTVHKKWPEVRIVWKT